MPGRAECVRRHSCETHWRRLTCREEASAGIREVVEACAAQVEVKVSRLFDDRIATSLGALELTPRDGIDVADLKDLQLMKNLQLKKKIFVFVLQAKLLAS